MTLADEIRAKIDEENETLDAFKDLFLVVMNKWGFDLNNLDKYIWEQLIQDCLRQKLLNELLGSDDKSISLDDSSFSQIFSDINLPQRKQELEKWVAQTNTPDSLRFADFHLDKHLPKSMDEWLHIGPKMTATGEFKWNDDGENVLGSLSVQMSLSVVINAFKPKNDLCIKDGKADLVISSRGWDVINRWLKKEGLAVAEHNLGYNFSEKVFLPENNPFEGIRE